MTSQTNEVISLLLDLRNNFESSEITKVDDSIILKIYELEKQYQFHSERDAVQRKLENIVENYLESMSEDSSHENQEC